MHATAELAFSDEQRGFIYENLMSLPGAVVAHARAPEVANVPPDELAVAFSPPAAIHFRSASEWGSDYRKASSGRIVVNANSYGSTTRTTRYDDA